MKHLLLSLLLLALGRAAAAMPADTVLGQARLVRQLSSSMCEHLTAEGQKTDLTKLSGEESKTLFNKTILTAITDHMGDFQAVQGRAGATKNRTLTQEIAQQAVLQLLEQCPASRSFLAQMGLQATNTQANLTAAERPVLAPIAQAICRRLDEENARQPFAQRTPEARSREMEQIMEGAVTANAQELSDYYGEEAIGDQEQMKQIGIKTALLVFEQCPSYVVLLGQDANRAAAPAPAARKPAPTPARRPAARRAVKK